MQFFFLLTLYIQTLLYQDCKTFNYKEKPHIGKIETLCYDTELCYLSDFFITRFYRKAFEIDGCIVPVGEHHYSLIFYS